MAKKKYGWVHTTNKTIGKPTPSDKQEVETFFQPLIEQFKKQFIKEKASGPFDYITDIYPKWYRSYFYLCAKYKSEHPNRIQDEYEEKFARLTFIKQGVFDIAYFRHTGQWFPIGENLGLEKCREMILSNPVLHPIG